MTKPYRAYLESYDWSSTCRKIKVNVYNSLNIYTHNRIGNTRGNQIAVVQSLIWIPIYLIGPKALKLNT